MLLQVVLHDIQLKYACRWHPRWDEGLADHRVRGCIWKTPARATGRVELRQRDPCRRRVIWRMEENVR